MNKIILVLILLSGCANMSPREKQTAWIVTGVVIGAVIISSGKDSAEDNCVKSIIIRPDGSSDHICR